MIRFSIAAPMFIVGLFGLALTAPKWGPVVDGETRTETPKKVKPLSERLGCPKWTDGKSNTVLLLIEESADGQIISKKCVRPKEATK